MEEISVCFNDKRRKRAYEGETGIEPPRKAGGGPEGPCRVRSCGLTFATSQQKL